VDSGQLIEKRKKRKENRTKNKEKKDAEIAAKKFAVEFSILER